MEQDAPVAPRDARVVLREARAWARDGLITPDQLQVLEARYAAAAEGHGAGGGFAGSALIALGVAVLGIAILFTVTVFWGDLSPEGQLALLLVIAAGAAGAGAGLRTRPAARGLGHGLLAVAAGLVPLACLLAEEAYPLGAARAAFATLAVVAPAAAVLFGHRVSNGLALFAYLAFLGGIAVATGLSEGRDSRNEANIADAVLLATTAVLVALRLRERPQRARWYEWAIGVNAALSVPAVFMTLLAYRADFLGDYTGILLLALVGGGFFLLGISLTWLEAVMMGGLILAGDALWLGAEFGDTLGVVVVLFAEAAILITAGQSIGWASIRNRFRRETPRLD